jgi:5-methylcytosine-specific restriction enzyme subunit McrC
MFDMNRLWEEYVLQILRKGNDGSWQIKGQESQLFWRRKTIRPDIVLEKEGVKYVIDTKWKVIDSNRPSDADLKQMYVYNHHWNAQQSMLLYPNDGLQTYNSGKFELPYLDKGHHSCKLGFVHVIKESSQTYRWQRIYSDCWITKIIEILCSPNRFRNYGKSHQNCFSDFIFCVSSRYAVQLL